MKLQRQVMITRLVLASVKFLFIPTHYQTTETGPYVTFDNLQLGLHAQHVAGRILRLWEVRTEVRNANDRDDFVGISMVMLDAKNSAIHCFIPAYLCNGDLDILREGAILEISCFEVKPCTKHYKITDHPFVINFNTETTFAMVNETWLKIEKEKFRVQNHEHLIGIANTNLALPDIVGQIISIEGTNLSDPTSIHRITVKLWLQP